MANNINKKINEWEKQAYIESRQPEYSNEKLFSSISSYNKEFVDFLIDFYQLNNKKILDYGCGFGMFADLFSTHSQKVSACDYSSNLLISAKKMCNNKIEFFEDDFFNSGLEKNSFDFIFCRGLGPLQKINYSEENSQFVKKLVSSLNNDGVAYFTLLGNLSGIPGNRLSGFQNHTLQSIYDFFSQAGYVSMINVFGKQSVIVTNSKESSIKYNQKMFSAVKIMLENLREFDNIGYIKGRMWSYVNDNTDQIPTTEFEQVENYLKKKIFNRLVRSLCNHSQQNADISSINKPLYFVAGDTDKFYERDFTEKLFRFTLPKKIPKWVKRKVFAK